MKDIDIYKNFDISKKRYYRLKKELGRQPTEDDLYDIGCTKIGSINDEEEFDMSMYDSGKIDEIYFVIYNKDKMRYLGTLENGTPKWTINLDDAKYLGTKEFARKLFEQVRDENICILRVELKEVRYDR